MVSKPGQLACLQGPGRMGVVSTEIVWVGNTQGIL